MDFLRPFTTVHTADCAANKCFFIRLSEHTHNCVVMTGSNSTETILDELKYYSILIGSLLVSGRMTTASSTSRIHLHFLVVDREFN